MFKVSKWLYHSVDMIGTYAVRITNPLAPKNWTHFFCTYWKFWSWFWGISRQNLTKTIFYFFIGVPQFYARNFKSFWAKLKTWWPFLWLNKKKILRIQNFICNFRVFRGKIWLWLFYTFFGIMISQFYTSNLK